MNDKPTGTVTFLFTDIEGSTKLAQEYPDTLQPALEIHHSILRKAVESNSGFVFEIVGDAFCCAFENAEDAVKAAVEAQINLKNEKWKDAVIKIRIGIHSGKAEWNGNGYMGYITLARTARVMSAAYGEQILISNDAYELVREKVYETNLEIQTGVKSSLISFLDLGERRLKDVIQPLKLFQILSKELRENFPPLKTLDARPNNLPIQLTSFIGRENEIKKVKDQLNESRLITLIGPGGSGKTRLAIQIGADKIDEFANGIWIAEIAPISDPELLIYSILKSLLIKEESGIPLRETLINNLKEKEMLLILDNCEHLINECAEISEKILVQCPGVKIIATSREALKCSGEQTIVIASLSIPDKKDDNSPEKIAGTESVRLFIERALSVNSNFRVRDENSKFLAEICRQLDGIPLAIELAAVRTKVLSVEKIYERLDNRFSLLTGGNRTKLPRQQTLHALIEWSYELLSEKEKILWRRLSLFREGWTLEAAEEICCDNTLYTEEILELLIQLEEKSIVTIDTKKSRYRMLETIREFGKENLNTAGETEIFFKKNLNYFLGLVENAEANLIGPEQEEWFKILDDDYSNIQQSLKYSSMKDLMEESARIAGALGRYWHVRGFHSESSKWFNELFKRSENIPEIYKAKILRWEGFALWMRGKYSLAGEMIKNALTIYKKHEETQGITSCLNYLALIAQSEENFTKASEYYEESLGIRRKEEDKQGICACLNGLGILKYTQGNYELSEKYLKESLEISKEIGDKKGVSILINNLGSIALIKKEYEKAKTLYSDSLKMMKDNGDKWGESISMMNLGIISSLLGEKNTAVSMLNESLEIKNEINDKEGIIICLNALGSIALENGDLKNAKLKYSESLIQLKGFNFTGGIAVCFNGLAEVLFRENKKSIAAVLICKVKDELLIREDNLNENQVSQFKKTFAELINELSENEFSEARTAASDLTTDQIIDKLLAAINENVLNQTGKNI